MTWEGKLGLSYKEKMKEKNQRPKGSRDICQERLGKEKLDLEM